MAKLLSGTRIYGTATVDSQLFINGNFAATSTTTGALQVIGGAGVGGDLWLGGGSVNIVSTNTNLIMGNSALTSTGTTNIILGRSSSGDVATIKTYAGTSTNLRIFNAVAGYHFDIASYATSGWGPTGANNGARIRIDGATGDVKILNTTSATAVGTGALQVAGGASISGNLYVGGTINATIVGISSTATNVSGGSTGQIHYQSAPGVTQFAGPGTTGQVLVSAGTTSTGPVFTNASSIQVGYATNILNGTAGQLNYQSSTSTTSFAGPGTAGQLLVSAGSTSTGPVFTSTSSIQVGFAANILGGSTGTLVYQSNTNTTAMLAATTAGYILQTNGVGVAPSWSNLANISAGAASKLAPGRNINGTLFDGTTDIAPTEWYHSIRDFTLGTLITTSIDYSVVNGDPFVLQIRGNSYGSLIPFDTQIQGYIYSSTIINTGGYSVGPSFPVIAMNVGGALCFWFARQAYWQGFNVHVYTALSTRAINKIVSITDVAQPAGGTKLVTITPAQVLRSDNIASYTAGSAGLTSTYIGFGSAGNALTGSANLKWDGEKIIISSGALGTGAGTQIVAQRFGVTTTNNDYLEVSNVRGTAGADWQYAGWRLQQKVDSTWMGYIQFNGTSNGLNNGGISFGSGTTTTNANSIVERMRIDSGGNVGIGNTNPGYKLQVTGGYIYQTQANDTMARIGLSNTNRNWSISNYGTQFTPNGAFVIADETAVATRLIIDTSGNVGIGGTPTRKLDVFGGGRFLQDSAATTGAIVLRQNGVDTIGGYIQWVNNANTVEKGWINVNTASNMIFATASTERMRITANGGISFNGASNYGTAGQFLQSNGDIPPSWVNSTTITVGSTLGGSTNYATSIGWSISSNTAQIGYYGGNFTLNGDGNLITYATDPFGRRAVVWQTRNNDATSDGDGGWDKTITLLSSAKSYMSVVYVIRRGSSTSGNFYHGCDGSNTLNLNGSANTNPYFNSFGISTLPQDVWCVSIGFIQAYGDSNTANMLRGGLYRMDTGQLVTAYTDYKMASGATQQVHRTYLYYSTDAAASLDWWGPGFYEINGNEPNLEQLLGSNNAGWRKDWYAPRYYDSDNVNYYLDPSGRSVMSTLLVGLTSSKTYGGTLQVVNSINAIGSSAADNSGVFSYDYNALDASPTWASAVLRKFGPSSTGNLYVAGIANAGWAEIAGINVSGVAYGTNNSAPVVFGTNSIERLRISEGGFIGVNNVAPDSFAGSAAQALTVGTTRPVTIGAGYGSYGIYGSAINFNAVISTAQATNTFTVPSTTIQQGGGSIVSYYDGTFIFYNYDPGSPTGGTRSVTLSTVERMRITPAGRVGIGTSNPAYTLDVAGTINATSIISTQGYADQTGYNNPLRLINPGGAANWIGTTAVTGAIKIKLPQVAPGNTMLRMTIKVYTYDGNSFTIDCGGYTYAGPTWYNTFAHMSTQSRGLLNVRFGNDGSTFCIYIGELGSSWAYPNVFVTDFQAGYSNYAATTWASGWTVSYEATAFGNVTSTQLVYTPVATRNGTRSTINFNSYLTTGFYNFDASNSNGPGHNYGQLIVAQGIDTGLQITGGYVNNLAYRGWYSSGATFTAWKEVLDSSNYSNYALPLSGGSLTGLVATRTNFGGSYVGSNDTTLSVRGVSGAHGAFMSFHIPGAIATNVGLDYDGVFRIGGWSYGATYVGVYYGQLLATSEITAYYSDSRLKTNLGNITGALAAVTRLNGFRYTNNELAETFGYTDKRVQLGVSAQEIKELFPEIVTIAPFDRTTDADTKEIISKSGENYLTIHYEKLTPVLIEAIKEQQILIETQQTEINQIKQIIEDQQKQINQLLLKQ